MASTAPYTHINCYNCGERWRDHNGIKCSFGNTKFVATPLPNPMPTCWSCNKPGLHDPIQCGDGYAPSYPASMKCMRCNCRWDSHRHQGRECQDGGPFIAPSVSGIDIASVQLGDKVLVYLDSDNEVTGVPTSVILGATIFAIHPDNNEFYLGWRDSEARPAYTSERSKVTVSNAAGSPGCMTYTSDQADFTRRVILTGGSKIHSIVRSASRPTTAKAGEQWRMFQVSAHPGLCPCGTTRSICSYHKDG